MPTQRTAFLRDRDSAEGLSKCDSAVCRREALDLQAIANTLADANPKVAAALDGWRHQINGLLTEPMVDDLEAEWQLEELAIDLRRRWIAVAAAVVGNEMRSPPSDHLSLLPVSGGWGFPYERVLSPSPLENKLKRASTAPAGWLLEVTLFSSGLAAIAAAITSLRAQGAKGAPGRSIQLDMFGGYFETLRLLDILSTSDLRCEGLQDVETVLDRFSNGGTDILFLEPIAYDWAQTVIDPGRLLEAVAARATDRPWILMLDTTLLGELFEVGPLLAACGVNKPALVLEIRSGLKLDQVGLEFSNVGIVRTLTPEGVDTERFPDAKQFHDTLCSVRNVLGSGLTLAQIALLDAPWIFHPVWMVQHSKAVMDNNRRLALSLSDIRGLFGRVNHPGLGPQRDLSWAESPIVICEFAEEDDLQENRDLLLAVIAREVRERRLILHQGASFGFRHHRCEIIRPSTYTYPSEQRRAFFKVAMGARSGPSLDKTIELMRELAAYPDFQSLRLAYPQLDVKKELARFPDLRPLGVVA